MSCLYLFPRMPYRLDKRIDDCNVASLQKLSLPEHLYWNKCSVVLVLPCIRLCKHFKDRSNRQLLVWASQAVLRPDCECKSTTSSLTFQTFPRKNRRKISYPLFLANKISKSSLFEALWSKTRVFCFVARPALSSTRDEEARLREFFESLSQEAQSSFARVLINMVMEKLQPKY